MGKKYLIDSNVVIEFLADVLPESGSNWLQEVIDQDSHFISVINKIELLGFQAPEAEMQILDDFVETCHLIPLTDEIVTKTIELRIEHRIKLPDAIIASTALVDKLALVTRNLSDFRRIPDLECINPHEV